MSRDLLFEIGIEELPAGYIQMVMYQLKMGINAMLDELRLQHGDTYPYSTPRRLAVLVRDVAERQADHSEEAMGPAAKAAFDPQGQPTRALIGFCQGKGVSVGDVRRVDTPKGEYVTVTVHHVGRSAADVLPERLAGVATGLTYPKSMRWDDGDYRAGRPVRWLVALLGESVLPVKAFGLTAGRDSFGHRVLHPGKVSIASPAAYEAALLAAHVIADPAARREKLVAQLHEAAEAAEARLVPDDELTDINNHLVEWPTTFAGAFDGKYLTLPREVTVTALREHQWFFALESDDGTLRPGFLAVRNGDDRGLDVIRRGNEGVLVARLEDALFYWNTDLKQPPAALVEKLDAVVWMEGLGSLKAKAHRLESLTGWLADALLPAAKQAATRAALLAKTDLLGEMIGSGKEYASLEGVMGGHYARRAGEPEATAAAIAEHYRPRGAGDAIPATPAGRLLALADKLDHVAGAFVAGKTPTGSEDPFGVRRAGNGAVRIVLDAGLHLDLRATTMEMTRHFFAADPELPHAEIIKKLGEFWRGRIDVALEERGVAYDTRDAALEARIVMGDAARPGWCDAADALARARTLGEFRGDARFEPLVVLYKRVANILKAATEPLPAQLDRARLADPYEKGLLEALDRARVAITPLWDQRDYARILPALLELDRPIHGFFDKVMVNVDDPVVRGNRLRLLREVSELFVRGWDLSRIVVEGERA